MKTSSRITCVIVLLMIAVHVWTPVASAHPLGNFTINHFAGLHVSREAVRIDYVLDMAEIPAFEEMGVIDSNQNGQAEAAETATYHPAKCASIGTDLTLRLNGQTAVLTLDASKVELPPGAGGLLTLRLTCSFSAPLLTPVESVLVEFEDQSYADRLGWREIVVTAEGVSLQGDIATHSLSQRLTAYPNDLLSSPLDQRRVSFDLTTTASAGEPLDLGRVDAEPMNVPIGRSDHFTQLITLQDLSLPTVVLALGIALVWGAMHALTPGHGKTIVGAYLVGSHGTAKHALYLGLTTTLTHTAGVFALGLATLLAANFVRAEHLYPWLSVVSGLLIAATGVNLFVSRLGGVLRFAARVNDHAEAEHAQHHDHEHAGHGHGHGHPHLPADAAGTPATWRNLLTLGITGGLLPCPSALVVMLSAIALDRIGFGLVLILTFSLGLAGVLTGIGLLFVYTQRLFDRRLPQNRLVRLLPAASALFIALAGLGITAQALAQLGILTV
jgi:nickel/cobalt exporter